MLITYDSLWTILQERNMSKKDLMDLTHISHNTMALMTQNRAVSLETLISICKALHCDFGDIIHLSTEEQSIDHAITHYVKGLDDPELLRDAVALYLESNAMSKNDFIRMTKISANTLQRVMRCLPINFSTYKKLMAIVDHEFMRLIDSRGH